MRRARNVVDRRLWWIRQGHSLTSRGERFKEKPKIELHRHLEGAVRVDTVVDLAKRANVSLPHGEMGEMTAPDRLTVEGVRKHIQSLEPFPDLASLLSIFDHTQRTLSTCDSFYRIAKEAVEDAWDEGIRLIELRYAPSFASMGHNHSFEDVLTAIEAGVKDGVAQTEAASDGKIAVGLICIGVGAMGHGEMKRTVDFFLDSQDRFVGFDMAGAEQNVAEFAPHFARVRDAGANITCHASEDIHDGVPENALCAVETLGASRIGHGIQIFRDVEIMERIRDRGVLLEVSVTSNYLTNAVSSIESHPVRRLWKYGIPVSINTDDPGIMAIDLNSEYDVWCTDLGFDENELNATNIMALEHSFLCAEERERIFRAYFSKNSCETLDSAAENARKIQLLDNETR